MSGIRRRIIATRIEADRKWWDRITTPIQVGPRHWVSRMGRYLLWRQRRKA